MLSRTLLLSLSLSLPSILMSCGSSEQTQVTTCAPGTTRLCACSATIESTQDCAADGSGWGACRCDDAGFNVGGFGGTGGSTGESGFGGEAGAVPDGGGAGVAGSAGQGPWTCPGAIAHDLSAGPVILDGTTAGGNDSIDPKSCLSAPSVGPDQTYLMSVPPGKMARFALLPYGSYNPSIAVAKECASGILSSCTSGADLTGLELVAYKNAESTTQQVGVVVDGPLGGAYTLHASVSCGEDGACKSGSKMLPNVLILMDYSTSMNTVVGTSTRWAIVQKGLSDILRNPKSFLGSRAQVAVMRFGHDPNAAELGTPIPGDASGLVDGQAVDFLWHTEAGQYIPCSSAVASSVILRTPAPLGGALKGIGSWTAGALSAGSLLLQDTAKKHPTDLDKRPYVIVVVTDGVWTSQDGTSTGMPGSQSPNTVASKLWMDHRVRTFVVEVSGESGSVAMANALAGAGQTMAAHRTFENLDQALSGVCD